MLKDAMATAFSGIKKYGGGESWGHWLQFIWAKTTEYRRLFVEITRLLDCTSLGCFKSGIL